MFSLLIKPNKPEKVAVLSKWSFVNQRITVKRQFTSVNWQITVKQWFTSCKLAVYKCKPVVYTCKVLNSRFTTVLVITLLDTVEVTSFFQIFFVKQWFTCVNKWFTALNCCFTVNHHFTSSGHQVVGMV